MLGQPQSCSPFWFPPAGFEFSAKVAENRVPPGWLMQDGRTIGNAISGADHADDRLKTLFVELYLACGDAECPVSTGRAGATEADAENDFDAGKTLTMVDTRGCVALARDNMGGVSRNKVTAVAADKLGGQGGHEEMPSHSHTYSPDCIDDDPAVAGPKNNFAANLNNGTLGYAAGPADSSMAQMTTDSAGTGTAKNMPPYHVSVMLISKGSQW